MLNKFKYAPIVVAIMLVACGGGGSDGVASSNPQMSNSVNPRDTVEIEVGKNVPISSNANVVRNSVTSQVWTISQLNGEATLAANAPTIVDASCTTATKKPGAPAANGSVGITGSSSCQTSVVVPTTAKAGEWSVKNTASSADGNSATSGFTLKIKSPVVSNNGFMLLVPNKPQIQELGQLATLAASYSVASGVKVDSVKYAWSQVSGEAVNIAGATTATPSFYPKSFGEYVLRVTATVTINAKTETQEGDIVVNVAPPQAQTYFTVEAGTVQVGKIDSIVSLKGTVGGNTPESSLSYEWTQVSGPVQAVLANASSLTPSFIPKVSGTYVFQLKASNTLGFKTATTTVAIDEAVSTTPFFAVSAGDAQLVDTVTPVLLKGTVAAGNPAPGNIVYQWTQTAGPSVVLSNPNTLTASFVATTAGNYEFKLVATAGTVTQTSNTSVVSRIVIPVGNTVTTPTTGNTGNSGTTTGNNGSTTTGNGAVIGPSTK